MVLISNPHFSCGHPPVLSPCLFETNGVSPVLTGSRVGAHPTEGNTEGNIGWAPLLYLSQGGSADVTRVCRFVFMSSFPCLSPANEPLAGSAPIPSCGTRDGRLFLAPTCTPQPNKPRTSPVARFGVSDHRTEDRRDVGESRCQKRVVSTHVRVETRTNAWPVYRLDIQGEIVRIWGWK